VVQLGEALAAQGRFHEAARALSRAAEQSGDEHARADLRLAARSLVARLN
jgi:cytochrome c-type biogenesis protein CcmH/NrfG